VTEAVLNTGLHRIADDRAKFSVAAVVEQTGVAFCCCCWIYIAVTR
jgi:coiled-coil and C2 domain-containing protein 2A